MDIPTRRAQRRIYRLRAKDKRKSRRWKNPERVMRGRGVAEGIKLGKWGETKMEKDIVVQTRMESIKLAELVQKFAEEGNEKALRSMSAFIREIITLVHVTLIEKEKDKVGTVEEALEILYHFRLIEKAGEGRNKEAILRNLRREALRREHAGPLKEMFRGMQEAEGKSSEEGLMKQAREAAEDYAESALGWKRPQEEPKISRTWVRDINDPNVQDEIAYREEQEAKPITEDQKALYKEMQEKIEAVKELKEKGLISKKDREFYEAKSLELTNWCFKNGLLK